MKSLAPVFRCIAAISLCASVCARAQPSQCAADIAPLTEFGLAIEDGRLFGPGQLFPAGWSEPNREVRYVRVLLSPVPPPDSPGAFWHLTIRDATLRPLETFSSSTWSGDSPRWTRRLDGGSVLYFDLVADSVKMRIELKRAIVMPSKARNPYYSVQDEKNKGYKEFDKAPSQFRALGDSVGMVMSHWGKASWCCSGVAVGQDLFLTNWHCGGIKDAMPEAGYWSPQVCANTIIDFSWDGDSTDREFICNQVIGSSAEEDFALLRIRPRRGEDPLRVQPIRQTPVRDGELVTIVHHAACQPKLVSASCEVAKGEHASWLGSSRNEFTHRCDTEQGSSGAPVFDGDGKLLGLHHLGFQNVGGSCDRLNKGIRIKAIIEKLPAAERSRLQQMLID